MVSQISLDQDQKNIPLLKKNRFFTDFIFLKFHFFESLAPFLVIVLTDREYLWLKIVFSLLEEPVVEHMHLLLVPGVV